MKINIGIFTVLKLKTIFNEFNFYILILFLFFLSVICWLYFSSIGLNLSYNDAMSHLDISRRVIDNIQPGLTQLGSVWLPLPHIFMLPTIWIDLFWRSGFSAGIMSMASYILSSIFVYKTVRVIGGNAFLAFIGALIVAINPNFLYLQTTALTEPLFIFLFSASAYFLICWAKTEKPTHLISGAFFIFLSTLTRYDGWFLMLFSSSAVFISSFLKRGWQVAKGRLILFATLAGFGIFLWLIYNKIIFGDALFFAVSEFSAKSQQNQMAAAGALPTKGNLILSFRTYYLAIVSNVGFFTTVFATLGWIYFMFNKKSIYYKAIGLVLIFPIIFNILSLFLGQSVIFLPETVGNSWFNVRYGLIVLPAAAVFVAYLLRIGSPVFKGFVILVIVAQSMSFISNNYVITIIDGVVGASQKNVKGLGKEIGQLAINDDGLILASAASHDAILFSSGIPMKRFIHEGTENLWLDSLKYPDRNAEYIIMRSGDQTDSVSRAMLQIPNFSKLYTLRYDGNFADFYQRTSDFKKSTSSQIPSGVSIAWQYRCIDTMKHSRDMARQSLNNPDFKKEVSEYILAIKNLNANCVAVGTPYDEEFLPILKVWADESHSSGLKVWYRGNWSNWEGWFNYPKNMSREEHLEKTTQFLSVNQELFENGDIFTPCPECEYGGPGSPLQTGDIDGFRSFMINENNQMQYIFKLNKKNILTNINSLNTDVAKRILDKETVKDMGNIIVLDHYASSVEDYKNTLDYFHAKFPDAKIVFGEFGAPIPDIHGQMDEDEQADFVNSIISFLLVRPEVIGLNYWVGSHGTTAILSDNFDPKPAADVISSKFTTVALNGVIKDENNTPIANLKINIPEKDISIKTDHKGEFSLVSHPGEYLIEIAETDKFEKGSQRVLVNQNKNIEIKLAEKHENILEKIKKLLN